MRLVQAVTEELVVVRLEVVAVRELRIVVQVAEVFDGDRLDTGRLQLLGDVEAASAARPIGDERLDLVDARRATAATP